MKVFKPLLACAVCALALGANASERITLKAAKAASSYYQMAVQVGETITQATNNAFSITIEESQGSVQNVKEARRRGGNYLFTTPPGLVNLAQAGKGMFEKDTPSDYASIRSLFPFPFITMHFVVAKKSGIQTFEALKGKSLLIGKGSFGANEAQKYIELFGLKEDVKLIDAELSGAVTALKNGQIDGFATSGSYPAPNVIEAAASMDIHILSMSDAQIALTKRDKLVIPAGTYAGVEEDFSTTTLPVVLYTTTQMSEATAYALTKAFWESKPRLEHQNIWWKAITPELLGTFYAPLHPGALKYYREIGATIPEGLY
ncbi:TAXI family TRAP transporter solute-binding subunit [Sulfurospirillum sp. T05]|uniref:TAXI family TRAP transporter solute-binding subunit n=1 Tax=Sulfurospirillum tamanense TaxID=2813362 RepID=A0ABS2WTK9_9BACT|nr:TAXI family TRAP transporter solute-binding subunit [Sulfurospirillum tamanensis]MBN2964999.1 TAXI family TRAP transporter solute-binding subunit [Sulfurospirillum tamanensis]